MRATQTVGMLTYAQALWRGSFPQALLSENDNARGLFFRSYQRTYIERDVRLAASVSDMVKFTDFLSLLRWTDRAGNKLCSPRQRDGSCR